jgi:uncharacterized metal-binding protein YceD (DUF177 family)
MEHPCYIELSRVKQAGSQVIDLNVPASFLELDSNDDLQFEGELNIQGKVSHHPDSLHLELNLKATASLPCIICSEPVKLDVKVTGIHHVEMLEDVRGLEYDYSPLVHDHLLLETPSRAECLGGCEEREVLKEHFAKDESMQSPFKDLELD